MRSDSAAPVSERISTLVCDSHRSAVLDWMSEAACEGDGEPFYDTHREDRLTQESRVRVAKEICISCFVRAKCLDFAIATDQEHGVWGGKTTEERRGH